MMTVLRVSEAFVNLYTCMIDHRKAKFVFMPGLFFLILSLIAEDLEHKVS